MKKMLSIEEIEKIFTRLKRIDKEREWEKFHAPKNMAKAIVSEVGELTEIIRWTTEYKKEKVQEELADVLINTLYLALYMNIDIPKIAIEETYDLKDCTEDIEAYVIEIVLKSAEILKLVAYDENKNQVVEAIREMIKLCQTICKIVDLDVANIVEEKLQINEKKYNKDKCKGKCKKYNEY